MSSGGLGERIRKPKGMHRRTFARERARVEEAETLVNGHLWAFVQKLNGQFGR